ncbi:MAG: bifunctional phosphoribosylaminoimidazolecarboxamide formyltransferase/IMP cyclohydrolase [Actinomycetota bacterium]|nr:bifunctional phosphoribosylaminoimidazolecarboxamide formyltransferase/IMP cyclohydrolase [Actinomycetota bacterium]
MTTSPQHPPVRRALISVHDKRGVAELAAGLADLGIAIVSTGSTARRIAAAGVAVTEVAAVTGFPECLDGRVKTLHPRVHAGILADRSKPEHVAQLDELGIDPVDLVVVNLYPFRETVASGAADATVVEMIDIGGPTLVRGAAKNHAGVAVVVDPDDYDAVLSQLRHHGGLDTATRHQLAAKAFRHTAAYDAAIAAWFQRDEPFPVQYGPVFERVQVLRYGENPHQRAAYYADSSRDRWGLASAVQHHGKELSYNNLLDTDAAWAIVNEFSRPCVAIIKHTNPAGVALADDLPTAYQRALEGDPVSAFGGIVAANRPVDAATAELITAVFTEVVVAPGYDDDALGVLGSKANLRVLEIARPAVAVVRDDPEHAGAPPAALRSVAGGLLVQDADVAPPAPHEWRTVSSATANHATMSDLSFAWTVARHVKSNAIVVVRDQQVVGVGAGQMSRVDAVRLAVDKSRDRSAGAVLASDAFFPFRDGPDAAAAAGVVAIIQPGGSVRDDEVVAAADEHGLVMVLTGRRHFRH